MSKNGIFFLKDLYQIHVSPLLTRRGVRDKCTAAILLETDLRPLLHEPHVSLLAHLGEQCGKMNPA